MKTNDMFSKIYFRVIYVSLWLLFAITACDNNATNSGISSLHEITFYTQGLPVPDTRAIVDTLEVDDTFGVLAYSCPDGIFHDDASVPDLLYNAWVQKFGSEGMFYGFRYIPAVHWPAVGKVKFVAYYPHSSSLALGTITVSPFTLTGLPKFDIELGREKRSVDFSTAEVGPISRVAIGDPLETPARTDNNVSFAFKRRMSYIQFRCKAVNMPPLTRLYINRITLRNIYRRGTFNMAANGGVGAWESLGLDATTGATINLTSTVTPVKEDDFYDLIDPNGTGYYVAMFPQIYDNVEMHVMYTLEYLKAEGGCEYRIIGNKRIPLNANWLMGKLSKYDIEFAFIEATGDDAIFHFKVQPWKPQEINTEM